MRDINRIKSGNAFGNSIISCFKKIGSKPLLLAFLFNLIAFLICLIFYDFKYEVSDDYITDAVLSGAFGNGYDSKLLFGNVILGYFLVFLYKLIPVISFYFVLLLVLDFISATVVLYLIFKKKTNLVTVCLACIFLIYFSKDLYVLIQFTKVSTAAGIAGGVLILHGLWEAEKHRVRYIISGTLLMTAGTMVRFTTIYVFALFLVLAFIHKAKDYAKNMNKEAGKNNAKTIFIVDLVKRFVVCVLVIGILFGIKYLGAWICSLDETYTDYYSFHDIRYTITDRSTPDFNDIENEYSKLGLDIIDYYMLNSWNFLDKEVYPDSLLQRVAAIHKNAAISKGTSFSDVVEILISRQTLIIPVAAALYLLVVISLFLSKKRLYPVVLLATVILLFVGLVYYGRIMYRVESSVYFAAVACLLSSFSLDEDGFLAMLKKSGSGDRTLVVGLCSIVVILGLASFIPDVITKISLLKCSDSEYRENFENSLRHSGEYAHEKAGFPSDKRKLTPNLIKFTDEHPENYYFVDFTSGIQHLYFNYSPWVRPEQGLFKHYSYYGGCTMRHPGERSALIANGVDPDNPYKSMANDNVYLIDNYLYESRILYFKKYYNPKAKMKRVGEIDGFSIWKVYIPD